MIVDDFFREGLRLNPVVGKFVVGGGLVLAVAAMAVRWFKNSWYADQQSVLIAVGGLLVLSLLVALLAGLAPTRDGLKTQRVVFSWALMALMVAYPWMLFVSIITNDWPKPFVCLTQPWHQCDRLVQSLASQVPTPPTPPSGPNSPGVTTPPAAVGSPVNRADYSVTLQFAGTLRHDSDTKPLTAALERLGWNVPEWEKGGQGSRRLLARARCGTGGPISAKPQSCSPWRCSSTWLCQGSWFRCKIVTSEQPLWKSGFRARPNAKLVPSEVSQDGARQG